MYLNQFAFCLIETTTAKRSEGKEFRRDNVLPSHSPAHSVESGKAQKYLKVFVT